MGSGASYHGPRSAPLKKRKKRGKKGFGFGSTVGLRRMRSEPYPAEQPPDERHPAEGVAEAREEADRYQHGNYQGSVLSYGLGK